MDQKYQLSQVNSRSMSLQMDKKAKLDPLQMSMAVGRKKHHHVWAHLQKGNQNNHLK